MGVVQEITQPDHPRPSGQGKTLRARETLDMITATQDVSGSVGGLGGGPGTLLFGLRTPAPHHTVMFFVDVTPGPL